MLQKSLRGGSVLPLSSSTVEDSLFGRPSSCCGNPHSTQVPPCSKRGANNRDPIVVGDYPRSLSPRACWK
ncbi:hypothetical protein CDAR_546471 [Caerostris darwini]|uniref:Uncharacterized protein n=1 Tax=Caerostris darwini TaxID=1538125 RepID=A0AAV4M607_9ARAC|nr:hypothetical protein CDAR_546471 [Caerostris darwini]